MYVLIQITAVATICWLLLVFLKRINPDIIQKIITTSLLLCLVAPILANFNVPFRVQTNNKQLSEPVASNRLPALSDESKATKKPPALPEQQNFTNNTPFDGVVVLYLFWLFGAVFMVYRHSQSIHQVRRLIRTAKPFKFNGQLDHRLKKKVNLLQHQQARIPFLYVSSEVFIVMPTQAAQWKTNNQKDVIQHELCHYRRKDHWLVWLSLLVSIVYWFHPLIRVLLRKQRQYIELACDRQLLAEGVDRHNYAESLMLVTCDYKQTPAVIGMATEPHLLSTRIQSIITQPGATTSIRHRCIITMGVLFLLLAGCLQVDQVENLAMSDLVELVSHDLPIIRNEKLPRGDLHLSAFYDGHDHQNTFIHLQLENQNKQKEWISLGPLKKFTEHIHTWHLKLSDGVELTGQYRVSGVDADGVVDGVAIGLVSLSHKGEYKILKTQGPIEGEVPNVLCSWPLWMGEKKFNKVLPQLSNSKPESVQRLLCGSQLMANGTYAFSF